MADRWARVGSRRARRSLRDGLHAEWAILDGARVGCFVGRGTISLLFYFGYLFSFSFLPFLISYLSLNSAMLLTFELCIQIQILV